jgi:hypothetical protein
MNIAKLVWGSLHWDPRGLATTGEWFADGPELPIEYARISRGNRLTLVIKPGFDLVTTLYAVSRLTELEAARENLRVREDTDNINNIGFLRFDDGENYVGPDHVLVLEILTVWNACKGFDAVIWSEFAPNFTLKAKLPFTVQNVITFLERLPIEEKDRAMEYIKKAPAQITTRFRAQIEARFP